MGRLIFSGVTICFSIVSLFAGISVDIPIENLAVKEGLNVTSFEGTALSGFPGQPELPVYNCAVLIPPDADPNSIQFSISGLVEETVEGSHTVQPAPPLFSCDRPWWPEQSEIVDRKDVAVYSTDQFFPNRYINQVRIGKLRCYTIAQVSVHLARYNPVSKTLRKLTNGTLTATYSKDLSYNNSRCSEFKVPASTRKKVKNLVVNYDEIASAYDKDFTFTTNTKYIIIVTAAVQDALTTLDAFIQTRQNKGFTVEVINESTVGSPINKFSPADIRSWLQNNYQSQTIENVLLIGCPHMTGGDLPMKTETFSDMDAGTDFYFAQLTGRFDDSDPHAEVDVGRIPIYYNQTNYVDTVLQRTINYESEIDISWRSNVFLIADPLDYQTSGSNLFETILDDIYDPAGWSNYRIYGNSYGNPDEYPSSFAKVENAWNSNTFGIIQYLTHGSEAYAMDVLSRTVAQGLTTAYNPIVYQGSCTNGMPLDPQNLGFTVLKRCALGVITASEKAYYRIGQTNFETSSSMQGFQYELASAFIDDSLDVAKALNQVKSYAAYDPVTPIWANICVFNLYGVPDANVFTFGKDIPMSSNTKSIACEKQLGIQFYKNHFYFQVPENGQQVKIELYNVQGKRVAILVDNHMRKGVHTVSLNKTSSDRMKTAAGLYLCKLTAGKQSKTINVILK